MMEYEFQLIQDDMVVASAISAVYGDALKEILHYASQYGQDGPVSIVELKRFPISLELAEAQVRLHE